MGLKVNFQGYSYNNPYSKYNGTFNVGDKRLNQNINLDFDDNYFQGLIANREFDKAADYAEQYRFEDPETQRQHENDIENIRYRGRIISAQYSKLDKTTQKPLVEFYDNLYIDNAFDKIKDNEVINEFNTLKRRLGSTMNVNNPNKVDQEATRLSVSFAPKQRSLFGLDWLKADNENNFDNFLERSGFTEEELSLNGIDIDRKDGNTIITFDKSNPNANKIIANLSHYDENQNNQNILYRTFGFLNEPIKITGYNVKGEKLIETKNISDEIFKSETDVIANKRVADDIRRMQNLIQDGKNMRENLEEKEGSLVRDYSSTIGAPLDDGIVQLNEMRNRGLIDDNTYYKEYKKLTAWIGDMMSVIGSNNIQIFTNAFNEDSKDSLLIPAESSDLRETCIAYINGAKPQDVHFNSMISDGQLGVLITIDGTKLNDEAIKGGKTLDDVVKGRRFQFFIPADSMPSIMEMCQASINRNTTTMAAREINAMQDFGYGYKLKSGYDIQPDGRGGFRRSDTKESISKQDAEKLINKDMIIKQASRNLKYKYMNLYGDIFDKDGYEEEARRIALAASIDLNPGIDFRDENGNRLEYSLSSINNLVDSVFSKKGIGSTLSNQFKQNVQYDIIKKYQDVYDVYDAIMKELKYYN